MNLSNKNELSDSALEARRKYYRDYYQKNKEKRKAWQNRLWERKASEQKEEIINNKFNESIETVHFRNQETERVNTARRKKTKPSGFTVHIGKDIITDLEVIQAYQLSVGSSITPLGKLINQILKEYCFDNKRLINRLKESISEDYKNDNQRS